MGDFSHIPILEVAHKLLGEEGPRSTSREKHFSDHGGLFINEEKGVWHSHANDIGGDVVALVQYVLKRDFREATTWLREQGYERRPSNNGHDRPQYQKPNGRSKAQRRLVTTYPYCAPEGQVAYSIDRYDPKSFSQWRVIDGDRVNGISGGTYEHVNGVWHKCNGKDPRPGAEVREFPAIEPVPYRLPELLKSNLKAGILITGGQCADDHAELHTLIHLSGSS
jgi:hypothetical protein